MQRESKYLLELERKYYKLMFHKKYHDMVTDIYLEQVIKVGVGMYASTDFDGTKSSAQLQ